MLFSEQVSFSFCVFRQLALARKWFQTTALHQQVAPTFAKKQKTSHDTQAEKQVLCSEDMLGCILQFLDTADKMTHCIYVCKFWMKTCRTATAWSTVNWVELTRFGTHEPLTGDWWNFLKPCELVNPYGLISRMLPAFLSRFGQRIHTVREVDADSLPVLATAFNQHCKSLTSLRIGGVAQSLDALANIDKTQLADLVAVCSRLCTLDMHPLQHPVPPFFIFNVLPECHRHLQDLRLSSNAHLAVQVLLGAGPTKFQHLHSLVLCFQRQLIEPEHAAALLQLLQERGALLRRLEIEGHFPCQDAVSQLIATIGHHCKSLNVLDLDFLSNEQGIPLLRGDHLADAISQGLGRGLQSLRVLDRCGIINMPTEKLIELFDACPVLECLELHHAPLLDNSVLACLAKANGLCSRAKVLRISAFASEADEYHRKILQGAAERVAFVRMSTFDESLQKWEEVVPSHSISNVISDYRSAWRFVY